MCYHNMAYRSTFQQIDVGLIIKTLHVHIQLKYDQFCGCSMTVKQTAEDSIFFLTMTAKAQKLGTASVRLCFMEPGVTQSAASDRLIT